MTALGDTSPIEALRLRTWRLIDIQSGETIAIWGFQSPGWEMLREALEFDGLAYASDDLACEEILIEGHPLEGAEYIAVNGAPVAFLSWDAHPISQIEMHSALFPQAIAQAAE